MTDTTAIPQIDNCADCGRSISTFTARYDSRRNLMICGVCELQENRRLRSLSLARQRELANAASRAV